jgi:hypothetical protein
MLICVRLHFHLKKIILSDAASNTTPKIFRKISSDISVANFAPTSPPTKNPKHIRAAILKSTKPCL